MTSIPFVWERIFKILLTFGIETRGEHLILLLTSFTHLLHFVENLFFSFFPPPKGILPVPLDERTDKPYSKIFFIWFSMNVNILSYVLVVEFLASRLIVFFLSSFCFQDSLLRHSAQWYSDWGFSTHASPSFYFVALSHLICNSSYCLYTYIYKLIYHSNSATWGPKLGMRQIIISRYSFG